MRVIYAYVNKPWSEAMAALNAYCPDTELLVVETANLDLRKPGSKSQCSTEVVEPVSMGPRWSDYRPSALARPEAERLRT